MTTIEKIALQEFNINYDEIHKLITKINNND